MMHGRGIVKVEEAKKRTQEYLKNPNQCPQCGILIIPREGERICDVVRKRFCSRSCSAYYNNARVPHRYPDENKFCQCGNRKEKKSKICFECVLLRKSKRTLADVASKYMGSLRWVNVRSEAQRLMRKWSVPYECSECGWNIHVEASHIRPIADFPEDTLVSVVNDRDNLQYLCPNCHWVFDYQAASSISRIADSQSVELGA